MKITIKFASQRYASITFFKFMFAGIIVILAIAAMFEIYLYSTEKQSVLSLEVAIGKLKGRQEQLAASVSGGAGDVRRIKKKVALVNDIILKKTMSWSSFFAKLEALIPKEIVLTGISQEKRGAIIVSGHSVSMKAITMLITRLEKSEMFVRPAMKESRLEHDGTVRFSVVTEITKT